jgi:glycosyltransferase involved in cell wall biosynthesis
MVSENNLSVLGNGIKLHSWRADARTRTAARKELGLADEFLWLAVGRLDVVKDYPTLLKAFAGVAETARLLVAGAGPLESELVQLAAQMDLGRRVCFLGFEPQVKRWMKAADGFILTSRYEGLPMVLLEAGACGLPVVATDVAGSREVVVNGETGWLARVGDAGALAKAMAELMQMPPEKRRAMGERARRHVAEQFGLETVLDRWEHLYAELLGEKTARRRIRLNDRKDLRRQSAASA